MYKFLMMTTSFWLVGISGGVVPRQESSSRQGLDAALLLQVFEVYSMPLILIQLQFILHKTPKASH